MSQYSCLDLFFFCMKLGVILSKLSKKASSVGPNKAVANIQDISKVIIMDMLEFIHFAQNAMVASGFLGTTSE